jgi:cobalt-zinc-cadmium efflux system membrane fusion protein
LSRFWWSVAAAAFLFASCSKQEAVPAAKEEAATPRAAELSLAPAARAFLTVEPLQPGRPQGERSYFGRTAFHPKALSAVTSPFAGRVATVAVEPGQRVAAGETLFTIESADALGLRAGLEQARIRLRVAEEALARQTEMAKRGVGLEAERFEAEMKAREARAEAERAERNAALAGAGQGTRIRVAAPVAGIVVSVKVTVGATVQPGGEALVEVGNPRGLWVIADVPEGEVAEAAQAKRVSVSVAALNLELEGRVAGVAPRSDPETRRTAIYVELPHGTEGLRAGLLVQVKVGAAGGGDELWLPVTAVLLKEGGRRVVYVEGQDGRFAARRVETGEERGGQVRVLKGLQPGERIVTRGALLVDREAEQLL